MDKNKYKTLAIGLDKEIYAELDKYCKEKSITKSQFMRKIVNNILNNKYSKKHRTEKDNRIVKVEVDNYSELEEYVKEKKFGNISSFATYSMAQWMSKYPSKNDKDKKG